MPSQRKLRPLLPNADTSPSPPPSQALSDIRRKREPVLAACHGCRKKKVKCNGLRPTCGTCFAASLVCEWPVPEGLSPRQAEAYRVEQVSKRNENLRTVFEMLRSSREHESLDILRKIKAADSVDNAIGMIVDASLLLPPSQPSSSSPLPQRPEPSRADDDTTPLAQGAAFPHRSHAPEPPRLAVPEGRRGSTAGSSEPDAKSERLFTHLPESVQPYMASPEPSLGALPLSRRTSASRDDEHLTHLLTLFWTWNTCVSRVVDRSLFLEDLVVDEAGGAMLAGPRFCSSFLVNAILAASCIYSTQDQACAVPGDLGTRGRHFRDEADRLLEQEQSQPSITLLQGLAVLRFYETSLGDGSRARHISQLLVGVHGALAWDVAKPRAEKSALQPRRERIMQAESHISWGIYYANAAQDMMFQRSLAIRRPRTPRAFDDEASSILSLQDAPGFLWRPYPVSTRTYPGYPREALVAECDLAELVEEVMSICGRDDKGKGRPVDTEACRALYDRLVCWKEALPDYLQDNESILPYVHVLHTTFDVAAIELLTTAAGSQSSASFGSPDPAALHFGHVHALLAKICTFRALHNLRHEPGMIFACFLVAKATLGAAAPSLVDLDGFVKACQALAEMGEHLPLANTFLHGLRQMIEITDAVVPARAAKYFDCLEGRAQSSCIDLGHWLFQVTPVSPMSEDTDEPAN